jgi:Fe(3+) dicitrate transport protein
MTRKIHLIGSLLLCLQTLSAQINPPIETLPEVVVTAEPIDAGLVQAPFLPDTRATQIFSGKKSSVIDFDAMPQIQTDNYRQAFAKTPGLLTSELSNPSLLSIGSRGIGDPHESQNLLVLKDGIPFVLDLFGYPTVYYAPPFESVDRLEFLRGGSSLLYGPQPSGSLNYVTHVPRRDRTWAVETQHVFGSDGLYSTYSTVDGTIGRVGYLVSFDHRQGNSFRSTNSDYVLDGGNLKLVIDADKPTRWIFNMDAYSADSGEPGGLTFASGGTALNYNTDRDQAQLAFDRVRVERYAPSLTYEHDFSDATKLEVKTWGGYVSRYSKRQRGTGFGTAPTGLIATTNNITEHLFYSFGTDVRLGHEWDAWDEVHKLTAGFTTYYSDSPFSNKRGLSPDAEDGAYFNDIKRDTIYGSYFIENKFQFGRLSVVPALRVEHIAQSIKDLTRNDNNTFAPLTLRDRSDFALEPLVGLGLSYNLDYDITLYGNVSQGYKPQTYADSLPVDNNTAVVDLAPGKIWTYETGIRGTPFAWLNWDTSVFLIDYNDRFGSTSAGGITTVQNVGRSINKGWDAALEIDLLGAWDAVHKTTHSEKFGSFSLYGNFELLDAHFISGPLDGKEPQYAPSYTVRAGAIYKLHDRIKLSFLGTFVGEHFANDNNTANFTIPDYMVWDLTLEAKVYKDYVTLLGGINNLFNEDYYSRIRSNGIDPANGRNFYTGIRVAF